MKLPVNFISRSFAVVGVAVAMYAAAALAFGWDEFRTHLSTLPGATLLALLALSFLNYGIRFWRWDRYLRILDLPLGLKPSLGLYFATYTMVITPGKVGEVFKAGILRERFGQPLGPGLAIVLAERIYDLLAVLLLLLAGLPAWNRALPVWSLLVVLAGTVLGLMLLKSPAVRGWLLARLGRSRQLARGQAGWQEGFAALDRLLSAAEAGKSLVLSVPAWACECLGLWLACRALGYPLDLPLAVFIYAAATVVGSVSFLPGGLGGTEVTLVWLLGVRGVPESAAIAVALVVRLATLWLAVLVGLVFFLLFRRLLLGSPPDQSVAMRS